MSIVFWLHLALVAFLAFVFPLWDRYETRRLKASPTTAARIRIYTLTIAWLWIASVLLLATVPFADLIHPPVAPFAIHEIGDLWVPVVIAMFVGLMAPAVIAATNEKARERITAPLKALDFMLPKTSRERWYFAAVSLSAGICEELVFRGFLIRFLDTLFRHHNVIWAIAAAALLFGLDHSYQGWLGMLQTTLLALLMTFLFYVSRGLWLPMAIHAAIDLRILLLLRTPKRRF